MNSGQDHQTNLSASQPGRPTVWTSAALLRYISLLLWLVILLLKVEVGLAQEQPKDVKQSEPHTERFRVERTIVPEGAELLTIWARTIGESKTAPSASSEPATQTLIEEVPILSVVRDTMGDDNRANDVLGELWVHTYTRPKVVQQAAAFVPFLYKGLKVEPRTVGTSPPRAIINLSDTGQSLRRRLFISAVTDAVIDHPLLKVSVHNYRRNIRDHRRSNLLRALTVLSLYSSQPDSDSELSEAELIQMQSQLALTEKTLGGLVDKAHFRSFYQKEMTELNDMRGHNWELLRQQAEASGLYFEPLSISEQNPTHGLLWFPAEELQSKTSLIDRPFDGRFLNIKNPWRDEKLKKWRGYSETKYFDSENRLILNNDRGEQVGGPDTRAVKMIPLGLYGLDFKKIPALLIDFRDSANPRRRELSGRLINDVLALSQFGNLYYLLGRSAFNFVTSRRGIDVNQPSRLRSAVELRLLLSFNENLSEGLRAELKRGLDDLTTNPLEHRNKSDNEVALAQYRALQVYAQRPTGLPARLKRQRESEAAKFVHQGLDGKLMQLANILTLGRYTHREKLTPELWQQLDTKRQLAHHIGFLREVAKSGPVVEVAWEMGIVLPSLRYIAENVTDKDKQAVKAVGSIFSRTENDLARTLCFSALKRIGNKEATREMSRIYRDPSVTEKWRATFAEYLRIEQPQRAKVAEVSSVGLQ